MSQPLLFPHSRRDSSVRVGPAGWSYKDWESVVYPAAGGRSFDPLAFLSDYFDTVEINSSFYAPPRPADAASWGRRVRGNPRFRFTAKAWRRLTHERGEEAVASLCADCGQVRRSMQPLADAGLLGALLIQFPWSFRNTPANVDHMGRLLRILEGFPLVVEVRHGSWNTEEFYQFLREYRVAFCNVDQPVIGNSLRPGARVTAPPGYMRLHGRNYANWFREDAGRDARYDYLYTKKEIGELAGMIRNIRQSTETTYAITNNHFRGQALVNALEIVEELDARRPEAPPLLAAAYPERLNPAS